MLNTKEKRSVMISAGDRVVVRDLFVDLQTSIFTKIGKVTSVDLRGQYRTRSLTFVRTGAEPQAAAALYQQMTHITNNAALLISSGGRPCLFDRCLCRSYGVVCAGPLERLMPRAKSDCRRVAPPSNRSHGGVHLGKSKQHLAGRYYSRLEHPEVKNMKNSPSML